MAELKVYEIEANITLNFNFEVDGKNRQEAEDEANKRLEQFMVHVRREFDSSDICIESVEESEGH